MVNVLRRLKSFLCIFNPKRWTLLGARILTLSTTSCEAASVPLMVDLSLFGKITFYRWTVSAIEPQRVLRARLKTCHPSNVSRVQHELSRAEKNQGDTVFDWLVEIIKDHGPGGSEREDGVELVLQ